jgi:hypothetical protein
MELLITIFGGLFFLFGSQYLIKNYNKKRCENKINNLKEAFSLNFYEIQNKKCSIKRLSKIDFIDKRLLFNKCNLFIENDFVIIQGIEDLFFKTIALNFIVTGKGKNITNDFKGWNIYIPKVIEISESKKEMKIVFKPNTLNNSDYSLIISDLSETEFEKLMRIKNYC